MDKYKNNKIPPYKVRMKWPPGTGLPHTLTVEKAIIYPLSSTHSGFHTLRIWGINNSR